MSGTNEELVVEGMEDLAVPCEWWPKDLTHGHPTHGTGPAVWIVTFRTPKRCGCIAGPNPILFCEGCWRYRSSQTSVLCHSCKTSIASMTNIIRVERI